jgi:hypothetical protein
MPGMASMIHVVSTAGANVPTEAKRKCIDSVHAQMCPPIARHHYIECTVDEYFPAMIDAIGKLPPDAIVANLDGDDWLGPTNALEIVASVHEDGALVTYGSFIFADGRPGFAAPYAAGDDVRKAPWRATHLKTFRAGLFQAIDPEDFKIDGTWARYARDQAFMLPMLEMAGHARAVFIPDILCVYNYVHSGEFQHPQSVGLERVDEAVLRGKKAYACV